MKTMILKLAAERAIQLATFSNFSLRLSGEPREVRIPGQRVTDTTSDYEVDALEIPVVVGYSDLKQDSFDLLAEAVEVPGKIIVTATTQPSVEADFGKLGTLRNKWNNRPE